MFGKRLVKMCLSVRNVPSRVTIAMQADIETIINNDDLQVDTLQKHFSHSK